MAIILTGTIIIDAYKAAKELKENQKNSSDYIASYGCDYIASYSCDYIASYSIAKLWMSKRKTKDVASASEYKLKLFLIIYYFIINSKLGKKYTNYEHTSMQILRQTFFVSTHYLNIFGLTACQILMFNTMK